MIDKVCSPGGTTIEAVTSLQSDGFDTAVHNAVDKAVEKDKLLQTIKTQYRIKVDDYS